MISHKSVISRLKLREISQVSKSVNGKKPNKKVREENSTYYRPAGLEIHLNLRVSMAQDLTNGDK